MSQIKKIIKIVLLSSLLLIGFAIMPQTTYAEELKSCTNTYLDTKAYSYNTFIATEAEKNGLTTFKIETGRVVEISEPLPATTTTQGDATIINAYKGTCCVKTDSATCTDTANVYFTDNAACELETGGTACRAIQILVSTSGTGLLKFYVLQIYIWAASVVGIIAVLIIVISGIQISASGGTDQISSAKTRITQSLAGLAILFLSALILYTINPTFFVK
ncbi:MAG: hypothetical protein WCT46_05615 [Candidatus Gracilibacteria bacterium]|jgi:hypothetical protein